MRNRTNCFRAKHENEVEAQGSEKLPVKLSVRFTLLGVRQVVSESSHLPSIWLGFRYQRRNMWVEFSVDCSGKVFSRYSSFSLFSKTDILNLVSDQAR